jgi:rhodanese-related sulfurtransferase
MSLEPNTCVRRTNSAYSRHGSGWLVFAKFIPGISTIAPPMAGVYGMRLWKFLAVDGVGAALWAGVFLFAGAAFHRQAETIISSLEQLGGVLGAGVVLIMAIWVLFRFIERQRIYRALRMTRIAPLELKQRIDAGEAIMIIDLRDAAEGHEGRIPGSRAFSDEELDKLVPAIAGTEMIIYCSCPDEISSAARTAMRLKRAGIGLVRTLEGGFPRWKHLGLPIEV